MNHLLMIDDDAGFCETIADYLRPEGFEVTSICNGTHALRELFASHGKYDLILLDTMLPAMNGFEILQRIRSRLDTPIIVLSVRNRKIDRIVGFETGADDFLSKPCNPRELLARIRAIFRRMKKTPQDGIMPGPVYEKFIIGDIALDAGSRVVMRDGEEIRLTAVEFSFLETLLRGADRIVTREQLARSVLGRDLNASGRSVDIHLSRLRKKLGRKYNGIERIKTVRGIGFIYKIPNPLETVSSNPAPR